MATRKVTPKKVSAPEPQQPAEPNPEALAAVKADAMQDGDVVKVVTWRGHTLTVPSSPDEWPVDVQEAMEDNRLVRGLRGMLGAGQWERLREAEPGMKVKDLGDLTKEIMRQAYGSSVGES
ncbi:MAG UNVERIFIED_CONTAM: hypothetical protein LOD86_01880 [Thermobifida fusca]|nr:hypothetical protein [Nocardiopsaceae bacterium]